MLDFFEIATSSKKRGVIEIYPKFKVCRSSDLMIRGGDFYAIWIEEKGLWSTDEHDALQLIDNELDKYASEQRKKIFDSDVRVLHMWDAESGMIDRWHKYCQKQMRDSFHMLDEKLIFSNTETKKRDYASKKLDYPLQSCDISAYNELMSTLYSEEERAKIEWAIGAIVTGDSKKIQKFLVLYGEAGTGKSTVLNIIQQLFNGYYSVFDAKALGSSNNVFALEAFKSNPLVAIQHDGDLSRIEDNTRLNSLVSHEMMTVNEKFKSTYSNRFKCFLFMGTNKPVKITDAKSGLLRRLIDVSPTGDRVSTSDYKRLTKQISFELGGIALHCRDYYLENKSKYDNYIPINMLGASNDFYNFVSDSYLIFKDEDSVTLKTAWEMYRLYCEDARVSFPFSQRVFKEELKNYFTEYKDRATLPDGTRVRSYYSGFKSEKFESSMIHIESKVKKENLIEFKEQKSILDDICADCPAQYASASERPLQKWDNVVTTLSDLDTSKLHFLKPPENHIVIDFDLKDENGKKSFRKNLREASKFPPTYAELSKSGGGIHLHYIYTGNVKQLSSVYDDNIEIKIFTGKASLRRQLTKCNDIPISTIDSGLPLKGENQMVNFEGIVSEKALRTIVKNNLAKRYHPNTKPSIDYIYKALEDAYNSGMQYDLSDLQAACYIFANKSSNQSDYCIKKVNEMKFKSDNPPEPDKKVSVKNDKLVFYDIEVFPNLFLVNWKVEGEDQKIIRMINPTPAEIEKLMEYKLVGFNCRRYDNHILYGRWMGYNNEQLYQLSQNIVSGKPNCFFGAAYNVSYTDVYDFTSKKQSLKKYEIELGIHHQELGLPWDQPVPKELWKKVAEYCDNDVIATEAVFNARKADFIAREILADVAGMTVNDTTNSLTTRIIFGKNRTPQNRFNYRNMGVVTQDAVPFCMTKDGTLIDLKDEIKCPDYTLFDKDGRPIFPGYRFDHGKSTYRGEEVGEGGSVYSEPGIYGNVALLDIASMHPSSIIDEELFGSEYTKRFCEIRDARVAIKHKDFDKAKTMLDGKLAKYLTDEDAAADLAQALKIAINSVYGLTAARFENPFKDNRNNDNIVAKRGALFMINLKHEVQARGFTVAHIKTDSIKIPDATPEIIKFVMDYGEMYGYTFEHEATYDRMCLVNDAVYVARYATIEECYKLYGEEYVESSNDVCKKNKKSPFTWTATGTQFQVPYVFKTLFSKEQIVFEDMCETKSVTTALYLKGDGDPVFIGRVGQFCPIKKDCGGKELLREGKDKDGNIKYDAVTGTKGYLWLESETVKTLHKEKDIDKSYYRKMVDDARDAISAYGDFDAFVSDTPWDDIPPFDI